MTVLVVSLVLTVRISAMMGSMGKTVFRVASAKMVRLATKRTVLVLALLDIVVINVIWCVPLGFLEIDVNSHANVRMEQHAIMLMGTVLVQQGMLVCIVKRVCYLSISAWYLFVFSWCVVLNSCRLS